MRLLLLVLGLVFTPTLAQAGEAERARGVRITAASLGAVTGVGVALGTVTSMDLWAPDATRRARTVVTITDFGVQTAASTWATWWFADRCLRRHRDPWRSIGWGVLYGMAAGAMSFGTGFGTCLTLGWATGAIDTGSLNTWWKVIPASYAVGSFGGALTCIPVGALLAPTISLTMRF